MKRYLALVSVGVLSITLYGQKPGVASTPVPTSPQGTTQAARAGAQAASVSAELTKEIDTKHAKVGDAVEARVTSAAKLPDGTELPRGTKLEGKVMNVHASSKEDKTAHLAFNLDHAVLKGGQQVPVHAALTSVTAPAQPTTADLPMSSGSAPASSGGGMQGGASGGSATSSPVPATTAPIMTESQPATTKGGTITSGQDHVPVGNLPGVMLTGTSDANSAGSLDAAGQNISLRSGTKLTLSLSAGA